MKLKTNLFVLIFMFGSSALMFGRTITLDELLNVYALQSPTVKTLRLQYANRLLEYENYRKGFLPSVSFDITPVSFNRSLRLLQDPYSGKYTYVKDYANSTSASITINQRIGPLGGTVTASTSLSYLREFSDNRNSYTTSPLYLSYSQPLLGGNKNYRLAKDIMHLQYALAKKNYCNGVSGEQMKILSLYLQACSEKMQAEVARSNMEIGDTLLHFAKLKLKNGYITQYDYRDVL